MCCQLCSSWCTQHDFSMLTFTWSLILNNKGRILFTHFPLRMLPFCSASALLFAEICSILLLLGLQKRRQREDNCVLLFFYLQERVFLTISNYIFTAIFVAEMTVKVNTPLHLFKLLSVCINQFRSVTWASSCVCDNACRFSERKASLILSFYRLGCMALEIIYSCMNVSFKL